MRIWASAEPVSAAAKPSVAELTENGYTPEFEAMILAEAEVAYAAVADGTAKLYRNAAELFADLDAEDDGSD
jgi:hypothetical protein